ncbi:MAG: hypothetical protein M3M94_01880, partial [Actinomycetota bacterium]|nr:hypothetical protein [Actinomycetota bacterium]
ASETRSALLELGRRFSAARPDAVIVVTPHNVHVEGAFAVVLAGELSGSLEDSETPVALMCPVDRDLARTVYDRLRAVRIPAVAVSYGGNDPESATMPMDWGTLVPLWFIGGRTDPPVPAVVIAPARELPPDTHVRAGSAIAGAAALSRKRVALVASADHGHAHDPDGPYGFDPAAAEYDARVVGLVREGRLGDLVEVDAELVEAAKADSFWQLLVLAGALDDRWQADLLSYEAPTYFGMLCAAFHERAKSPEGKPERQEREGPARSRGHGAWEEKADAEAEDAGAGQEADPQTGRAKSPSS